jgi:hypothetical protein
MTFEELYTARLNVELNSNSSNGVYGSTFRQQAINDGYREFAMLTECWIRRATITVSCNTAEYVLSTISDFRRIHASGPEYRHTSSGSTAVLTVLAGKDDFPRRDGVWLNTYATGWQSTTPGMPTGWYLRNQGGVQRIGLDLPPDVGSSETAVIRLPYIAEPDAMTASTAVPFSDTSGIRVDLIEYHQALAHYGASKLLPLTGDLEGAQRQVVMFTDYIKRFFGNLRPKGGTHVTVARSYLSEARRRRWM